jgi:RHS repeat-associated protein
VLQAKTGTAATQYVYSLGTRPLAEYEAAAWEYLLADPLGSVRQIANSSGDVTLLKSYEPYGSVLNSQGSATSVFGYSGEQIDSTGLIYLRARYMQPGLGVFLSHDPWEGDALRPGSMNGWNYVEGNPINRVDPTGFQSVSGPLDFAKCFGLHTATPFFGLQDSTTAKRAVEICKAAYTGGKWSSFFNLGQDLPTTANELFGWFVHDWRGGYNSDRLYFDANQPLTREVLKTMPVNRVRHGYYADPNMGEPMHYEFDAWQQFFALLDMSKSLGQGSASISMFMGSFWYQVKNLPNGRVGFRIDNDTTLSSGSHIVGRFKGYVGSVEELIERDPSLANKSLQEIIRDPEQYPVISILANKTRGETGGQGGGNLYQTFYWTEKRACTWGEVWFGDPAADMQVWEWGDFKSRTMDPPGFPPN